MAVKKKKPSVRMKTYVQRQKERGLVSINIWIPVEYAKGVREWADRLRREHGIITKRSTFLYGSKE
jgi:hypothetical protein